MIMKLKCYYSPSYFEGVTHLDQSGKSEYFLDSVIKPKWVYEQLKAENYLNIVEPLTIEVSDLLKVHSTSYIEAIQKGQPVELAQSSGLRWTPSLYRASLMAVSGFFRALETALKEKSACSLSTSFHHAQKENGGGFCVFNGMAITALKALSEINVEKIAIIDCDYHYADGTMNILANHPQIDIYDIYGGMHSKSINLIHATNIKNYYAQSSDDYNKALRNMFEVIANQKYDAILYDAGMDIWINDRIGGISRMDEKQIKDRDERIFEFAKSQDTPIAFMLGGGYVNYRGENGELVQSKIAEERQMALANLHANTVKVAYQVANSS
jgi:acetoin utilization deacetylase AcuC-like enzyme